MKSQEKIAERARELQQECHTAVEALMKSTKLTYQDATNVWIFKKLAELEDEIEFRAEHG